MNITVILGVVSGVMAAIATDLSAYRKALAEDPTARFDWLLAIWRWIQGGLAGAAPALIASGGGHAVAG